MNTSASDHQPARVMNEYEMYVNSDNMGTYGNQPSGRGNAIYGQVVSSPQTDDHTEHLATSSSLVYADLEFVTKITKEKEQTHSNQRHKNKTLNVCTGPMGDVYAMVQK